MEIKIFIEQFKEQLEDPLVELTADTEFKSQKYWDSLTAMVVTVMIEDEYNVQVDPMKLASFKTIEELYNFVESESRE